jgi:3-hydroxybutyryl-CoA dehydrogenase
MMTSDSAGYSRVGVVGSGAIACGLAACATASGDVRLLARSDASAWRAEEVTEELCGRAAGGDAENLKVTTDIGDLAECELVIEAIVEEFGAKRDQLTALGEACVDADLASTTSSLGVGALGEASGAGDRLFGLHVFNPVTRMELVELCLPEGLAEGIAERARAFCEALGKRAVEVPDQPGFVVNRLLFPFLFDAVRLLERTGMSPEDVDACMALGAGHPMGPLKILDLVGIDVSVAIGGALQVESGPEAPRPPELLARMVTEGKLGRKSGSGFYEYD